MKHLLYFTAEWCNPCARTRPFAEELVNDGYPIKFIDADSESQMIKNFGIKLFVYLDTLEPKPAAKIITSILYIFNNHIKNI